MKNETYFEHKEEIYNDWWNSLDIEDKVIVYWKMGDYFAMSKM